MDKKDMKTFCTERKSLGLLYVSSGDKGSALEEYKILKNLDQEKANQLFNLIYK